MSIQNHTEYLLFRLLQTALYPGSTAANAAVLALLAKLGRRLPPLRRGLVLDQLRQVYPGLSVSRRNLMADGIYRNLALTVAEVLGGDLEELASRVTVEPGWEPLDQALAAGRGAIVATGHIGNFELGGLVLARRHPLLDVVKPQRNPFFDKYLEERRRDHGIVTVPVDGSGPAVVQHLRKGGIVSLLLDQDAGADGVMVPWLGQMASTWPGAARLALRTGCPVVPMALMRQSDGNHSLKMRSPLWPGSWQNSHDPVGEFLGAIIEAVEGFVHAAPEQWFWVHRRWKTRTVSSSNPDEMNARTE